MASTDHIQESVPNEPRLRDGEHSFKGKNNQLIIMGRDRPSGIDSGYGSGPEAGTIHIVVGRKNRDPSLIDDASYIYTTMKTDVETNIGVKLSGGKGSYADRVGPAIIMKSDNVRTVFRSTGDVRITSEDGQSFIILTQDGCEVKIGSSWLKMDQSSITIEAGTINLGKGASKEKVVLGTTFKDVVFNQHTHQSPVGPTSIPLQQMNDSHLSGKSLVE